MRSHEESLAKAASFFTTLDQPDGSFPAFVRGDDGEAPSPTGFQTCLILTAVADAAQRHAQLRSHCDRALAFVRGEAGEHGSYNYWKRSARASMPPIPDDLDDTAMAYAARAAHGERLSGGILASLARLLPSAEIAEGGPYGTWLADPQKHPAWRGQDPVVNANIAYLLSLLGIRLPNLDAYLARVLRTRAYASAYYPDPLAALYFIARGAPAASRAEASACASEEYRADVSALHDALAAAIFARAGDTEAGEGPIRSLLAAQEGDGAWPSEPLYFERVARGERWYAGSRALTTAIAIDALSLAQAGDAPAPDRPAAIQSREAFRVDAAAVHLLRACERFPLPCKMAVLNHMNAFKGDPFWRNMMELPMRAGRALGFPPEDPRIATILDAHMAGLAGYSLLDAIADGEREPALAPCAAFLVRRCTERYRALFAGRAAPVLDETLSTIEIAVASEAAACLSTNGRGFALSALPSSADALPLADKSIGVMLPAIALLLARDIDRSREPDGEMLQSCREFFRGILGARQWNDDAHDLIDDATRGRVTRAGWEALTRFAAAHPGGRFDPASDARELQSIFWHDAFPAVCDAIGRECCRARTALAALPFGADFFFESIVVSQERTLERSRCERDDAISFITAYRASAQAGRSPLPI